MTTVMYVYKSKVGSIYQTIGVPKGDLEITLGKTLTDEEYKAIVKNTCEVAEGCEPLEIKDPAELPDDDLFPCWEIVGDKVKIHMDKLKEWGCSRIRSLRSEAFANLDIESTRAIEDGDVDKLTSIKLKKTQLRDLTEDMKNLTCPNGIHACKDTLKKFRDLIDNSKIQEILTNGEDNKH